MKDGTPKSEKKTDNFKLYERLLREGVFAKYKRRTYDALCHLSEAIKLRPRHYECYLQKGLAYFSVDQKSLAIQYIEEGYRNCYHTMTPSQKHTLRGLLYELKEKKYGNALNEYKRAIKSNGNNDFALNAIGYIYHIKKKYKKAIKYYFRAISSHPKYGSCVMYCNIGLCYEKLGDRESTLKYYSKSISVNSEYLEAYIYRSQFYSELGRREKAEEDLRSILRVDRHNSLAIALLGDVYYDESAEMREKDDVKYKRLEELALEQYKKANRIDPTSGSFYEILASWEIYKFSNLRQAFDIIDYGIRHCLGNEEIKSLYLIKAKFCKFVDQKLNNNKKIYQKLYQINLDYANSKLENRYKMNMKKELYNQIIQSNHITDQEKENTFHTLKKNVIKGGLKITTLTEYIR